MLNQEGKNTITIGWWPSNPAEPLSKGVMVSNDYQQAHGNAYEPEKWPLKPGKILGWIPNYLWPWNTLHMAITLAYWYFVIPDAEVMKTLSWGWALWLYAVNAGAIFLIYGSVELFYYAKRRQGNRFKYNAKFPSENPSDVFWFKSQNIDNFMRSFFISIPLWTVVEVLFLPMCLARPDLAMRYAFIATVTSVLGGIFGVLVLKPMQIDGAPLLDPKQATLISLALAAVIATGVGLILLRQPLISPLQEGRRLMDTVGWAALLPQMLAALGAVFALAGVGETIGQLVTTYLPMDARLTAVAVYCLGMAGFTMIMGNAFAAFPVMTAGVALPILIGKFGGDPAVVASIGMLSGFCGTLMTPLAANFNLVPAALLELPNRYAVIRAQIPTALPLLIANMVLMYVLAFR